MSSAGEFQMDFQDVVLLCPPELVLTPHIKNEVEVKASGPPHA